MFGQEGTSSTQDELAMIREQNQRLTLASTRLNGETVRLTEENTRITAEVARVTSELNKLRHSIIEQERDALRSRIDRLRALNSSNSTLLDEFRTFAFSLVVGGTWTATLDNRLKTFESKMRDITAEMRGV